MPVRWFIPLLIVLPTALKPADRDLVVMEQLVVEASHTDWSYWAAPGYEVLSRCDEDETQWFASGFFRSDLIHRELLGPNFLPTPPVPFTAILYHRQPEAVDGSNLLVPRPVTLSAAKGQNWGDFRLMEMKGGAVAVNWDTAALAANLWTAAKPSEMTASPLIFADGGLLAFRLLRRHPAPPEWFIAGLIEPDGLARTIPSAHELVFPGTLWVSARQAEADLAAARGRAFDAARQATADAPEGTVMLQPFVVQAGAKIVMLPLAEIFRERGPREAPPSALWRAEAALFVRWGLLNVAERGPLLQFAGKAAQGRVDERTFQACFGFGYTAMELKLAAYLQGAASGLERVPYREIPRWPPPLPRVVKRPATEIEIARIIGDWERISGLQLKARRPELAQSYFDHAAKLLVRQYEAGVRDPQVLAVLGLCDHDVGNDVDARSLLEAAAAAHVPRPEVYSTLAHLRLAAAALHPQGPHGALSVDQAVEILTPNYQARRLATLPLSGYLLIAEVLDRNSVRCTAGNLGALSEGIEFYPRSVALAQAAAKVATHWGYPEQAVVFAAAAAQPVP